MILSLWVPCGIIAALSIPLVLGTVPPNRFYGFRTKQTLADRDLWFRVNRFSGSAMFIAAAVSAAIFTVLPEYASGRSLVGLGVFIVPLAAALAGSLLYLRSQQ